MSPIPPSIEEYLNLTSNPYTPTVPTYPPPPISIPSEGEKRTSITCLTRNDRKIVNKTFFWFVVAIIVIIFIIIGIYLGYAIYGVYNRNYEFPNNVSFWTITIIILTSCGFLLLFSLRTYRKYNAEECAI